MKALIAFIIMAGLIVTLIEINERIKAKRARNTDKSGYRNPEDCQKEKAELSDCSACALMEVCEKDKKDKPTNPLTH